MYPIRYLKGVTNMCYAEQSKFITSGQDNKIKIWNSFEDMNSEVILVEAQITSIAYQKNSIYVANNLMQLKHYNLQTKEDLGVLDYCSAQITTISVNELNTLVFTGLANNQIKLIDIKAKKITTIIGHEATIFQICLDPLEKYFVAACSNGAVRFWTQKNFQNVHSLINRKNKINNNNFWKMAWHKSGNIIAVPCRHKVNFYERSTWQNKFNIRIFENTVSFCEFSPDITKVLIGTLKQIVFIFSIITKRECFRFSFNENWIICSLAWNPENEKQIIFCDKIGNLSDLKIEYKV